MIRGNSYVFALLRAFGADFFSQVLGQVLNIKSVKFPKSKPKSSYGLKLNTKGNFQSDSLETAGFEPASYCAPD
ncbi:hypothetical protein IQB76_11540 [Leptospira borgpetersenii serovar Hardjo-bovis]|uniref:Uncharacterized protein n=2 Tax=Leptospira borgpetersenii TaxID=174 RepID=Q04W37_LEPBJ|nr:Hypothetical protein LBJ_0139 [Leptospira borgpetersenii serovar Hardjo-bovis str. JB197]ABJ80260.1 Hypothetical protein LBL_2944 [Leptospira borgpetersenii serovar Hardjo-bovis str. L550]AMX59730.1 hypothetical protein LBK6_15810 [Leptospira borgpetersenii serovar Hardjo]MBE8351143.1 hypothetical protein [Leptospira borgpetersenii serovar Hardjo-bovis]MBF3378590.1 hypothetical protein [Leptospira borgpetersenii serovar Balcanica]